MGKNDVVVEKVGLTPEPAGGGSEHPTAMKPPKANKAGGKTTERVMGNGAKCKITRR